MLFGAPDLHAFGWYPTDQVYIHSDVAGSPKPLLTVKVTGADMDDDDYDWHEHRRAEEFSGNYVIEQSRPGDRPSWKCHGDSEATIQEELSSWQRACSESGLDGPLFNQHAETLRNSARSKLLRYDQDQGAWLLQWDDNEDEFL